MPSGKKQAGTGLATADRGGAADRAGLAWEYAPAPESRDIVTIAAEYGLFINGEFRPAAAGGTFATINPATGEQLAAVAEAGAADVDQAVAAARTAYEQVWRPMPGSERAKYLFRIARVLQERAREFAVLETLDNGKPIRESRDVDIPLAAAHFFYYAGWADKLEHAGLRPGAPAARRGRPGDPVELPAADGGVEAGARARGRQHLRAQAGRDDATDRAAARRRLPAGRPASGRGQRADRRRRDRGRAGRRTRRRQDRLHRFDRGRQADRRLGGRHRQEADAGTGRQGRQHRLRRRASRAGHRGHRQRDLLQPGSRLLRRLAPAGPGVGGRRGGGPAQATPRDAAPRRPDGQEHRHRRHQLRPAARQDHRADGRWRSRGR